MNHIVLSLLLAGILLGPFREVSRAQYEYSVVDLGTLGGSYARAFSINDSGLIAGVSSLSNGAQHAFVYQNGIMTDLGLLPSSSTAGIPGPDSSPDVSRVVFSRAAGRVPLAHPLGGGGSSALGINNGGQIVGNSQLTGNLGGHAFLYDSSMMKDLGTLLGSSGVSVAMAINDSGYVVGYSDAAVGRHAFRYRRGNWTDLGTIGYVYSFAYAINRLGEIAGVSTRADTEETSFLYQNGTMVDIGTLPGGTSSGAFGINNRGHVVGFSTLPISGEHAYIYRVGAMDDLGSLGNSSQALGINDSDEVVGWTNILPSGDVHAALWKDGSLTDLNTLIDPGSGWTLQYASAINSTGQIVGYGIHSGLPHAFLLNPPEIRITRPNAAELWIAGETDTIKWRTTNINQVNILLSTDYHAGAGTFNELAHGYPADSGRYIWQIPDTILSRKCAIQIEDTDLPDSFAVSDSFRIKPYVLTRVDANGDYVPFLPGRDGWRFTNGDTANLWPYSWWSQFDYSTTGIDPYTFLTYPADFPGYPYIASSRFFPDWPAFVDAFGPAACYTSTTLGIYSYGASQMWGSRISFYNGSCYGLAYSSLLAFDDSAAFRHLFPGIGPSPDVYTYVMTIPIRKAVNRSFVYQFGKASLDNDLANAVTPPKTTLDEIKAMFRSEINDHRGLTFYDPAGRGAHEVTPVKITRDPATSNWMRIYLYNSNSPGSSNDYIIVDTVANQWKESTGFGWGWGTKGMYLDIPSSSLLLPAVLKTVNSPSAMPREKQALSPIEISVPIGENVHIHAPGGDSIGTVDGAAFSSMSGGIPIIPKNGFLTPPLGYYLQPGLYTAVVDSFSDSVTHFSVMQNGMGYDYARSDAAPNQRDLVDFGNGLSLKNPDVALKSVTFDASMLADSADELYSVSGWMLSANDSVALATVNGSDLNVVNAGLPKIYALKLRRGSASGEYTFLHSGINLQANASHRIAPAWSDLAQPVKVYVDLDNNGTIEDTLVLDNQITSVRDQKKGEIPREFALYQNYPNPFNPVATIAFDLPVRSRVSLRIYNLLGQMVATLTTGIEDAGRHAIEWNALGVASGVYLYRLDATSISEPGKSYTQVRKMVLIR